MNAPPPPKVPRAPLPSELPAEVAAQVAQARRQVDIGVWVVIVLGLAFTAVNVQAFAAGNAPAWSPPWAVAWLLDPMVSVLLLSVVRAEQVTARWQVSMGWQVTASKWGCFAATYAMNTWASWRAGLPSGVVLHSVPPVAVLLAAEAAPIVRDRLTAAANAAAAAYTRTTDAPPTPVEPALTAGPTPPTGPLPPPAAAPAPVRLTTPPAPAEAAAEVAAASPEIAAGAPGVTEPPPVCATSVRPARDGSTTATAATGDRPDRFPPPAFGPGQEPAPEPGRAPEAGARPAPGGEDPRVGLLVELLGAGNPVTGLQAAVLLRRHGHETSDRTGRRLLTEARQRHTSGAADQARTEQRGEGSPEPTDGTDIPAGTGTDDVARPVESAELVLMPGPSARQDGGRS